MGHYIADVLMAHYEQESSRQGQNVPSMRAASNTINLACTMVLPYTYCVGVNSLNRLLNMNTIIRRLCSEK